MTQLCKHRKMYVQYIDYMTTQRRFHTHLYIAKWHTTYEKTVADPSGEEGLSHSSPNNGQVDIVIYFKIEDVPIIYCNNL